ncbi:MAG TPA: dihydrolipoyl dehydrogenase [Methanocella sp.]|nr:dihydrolipoyl dehydrogenase [Methanocella sp.]
MEQFDLIVIGSGAGELVMNDAITEGLNVALVDPGPLGGTCLNNGCIPSKMLIYPADVIRMAHDAKAVGVQAMLKPDFKFIMDRMRSFVDGERRTMEEGVLRADRVTWIKEIAEFAAPHTLKAGRKEINAPKIVIASGARALIPPLPGLQETGYLDNVSLLQLRDLPKSIIILGGGYIGCEYGHFFSAMGAEVTIVGRPPILLNNEDPEISAIVTTAMARHINLRVGYEAERVAIEAGRKIVYAKSMKDGTSIRLEADEILVALGRRSNSDLLKPENAGIETLKGGWIKVDSHLETNVPGIWAIGDATGKQMFRHTANHHATIVAHNLLRDHKLINDEHAVPHAVFCHPQVAAVGVIEAQAKAAGLKIMVGRARYADVAKGVAMAENDGMVKVVVEFGTGKILGCSVVGPEAPDLLQQIAFLMNAGAQDYTPLYYTQVIHPAMSEVIIRAFSNIRPVD